MSRWQDAYRVGQRVEHRLSTKWNPGVISRKTASGKLIVREDNGMSYAADRKADLRPLSPLDGPPPPRVQSVEAVPAGACRGDARGCPPGHTREAPEPSAEAQLHAMLRRNACARLEKALHRIQDAVSQDIDRCAAGRHASADPAALIQRPAFGRVDATDPPLAAAREHFAPGHPASFDARVAALRGYGYGVDYGIDLSLRAAWAQAWPKAVDYFPIILKRRDAP